MKTYDISTYPSINGEFAKKFLKNKKSYWIINKNLVI